MPVREGPAQPAPPPETEPYSAEKARGGEIILRRRAQRVMFAGGLIAGLVLLVAITFFAG